ncbi:putative tyrosine-protein phosphatase non-receptor type [Danaus plexippus plexippus]|uniref:Tyrosine-protein phosphatase non-receptor type n=1 Tax=Danaus plexippus plexippus TaxID=278856 RepID=A0A212FI51_DANPL|nr:putative tyrosine-protein phosphatase non-receptor type [Danaus plexippus plexippus]
MSNNVCSSDGGFLERVFRVPLTYVDDSESESVTERAEEDPAEGVVCVRLYPGTDGRYGFNVRGGGGGAAVLVSRVMPRTRAHLQEGDQVISINGTDVEEMTHEQVVQTIRNTKGVLTLMVKPNAVYEPEVCVEEPAVCFVPLGAGTFEGDLQQSMLLLGDGLASGAALRQYDALLRRAADRPATAARLPANLARNRYRDIAPYDSSRVILKNGPNGDYINASYINMEIANSDLVLTYIATQGPLASTVGDFWQMVWESESSLVVMLTVLAERGRAKCHQYWPKVGTALKATNSLTVVTNSEQNLGHYTQREMSLKDSNGASRDVTQLQYTAWPDHGVPDDHQQFISFINFRNVEKSVVRRRVRTVRSLVRKCHTTTTVDRSSIFVSPAHISEYPQVNVDLTFRFIISDTAILTSHTSLCDDPERSQYKFVCESIQSAYAQGLTDEGGAN